MGNANGVGPYIDMTKFEKPEGDAELEDKLDRAREAYSNAINDMIDRLAAEFHNDQAQQYVVQDFALFALFLGSVKMVELAGEPPHRKRFLSALRYLLKRGERELPEQIITLARHIAGGRANEDGETVQ